MENELLHHQSHPLLALIILLILVLLKLDCLLDQGFVLLPPFLGDAIHFDHEGVDGRYAVEICDFV